MKLYFSGDSFFNDIVRFVDESETEVLAEFYIFELDQVGMRILDAFTQAVARGVRVALLVDGFGSFMALQALGKECQSRGIQFSVYHPIWFLSRRFFFSPFHLWNRWRRYSERSNKRTHRKIVLIDEKAVFIGSMNISNSHSEAFQKEQVWRDTGLLIEAKSQTAGIEFTRRSMLEASQLSNLNRRSYLSIFRRDPLPRLSKEEPSFRLNSRLRLRRQLMKDFLLRLRHAKKRIWITNAYFLPRRKIVMALKKAAQKKGVEVILCLPKRTDAWIVREASWLYYYTLLKSDVKIYEYVPTMMHAKTMIIDDWVSIGSQNLNHRSLLHDLEIEVGTYNTDILSQLEEQWRKDLLKSELISPEKLAHFGFFRRLFARLILVFRYFI